MSFAVVAIGGSALIGAGASIYSAKLQGDAAQEAAQTQAQGNDRALDLQRELYQTTRGDLAPYREAGQLGLQNLASLAGQYTGGPPLDVERGLPERPALVPFSGAIDLFQDPSFQFRLREGARAVEQSAAAKGQLQSGNTLKDLTRFGQNLASQEYGAAYQRSLQQNQVQNATAQQGYQNEVGANQNAYQRALDVYGINYNRLQNDQQQLFNRYGTLATLGQGAATQTANANTVFGQQAGANILGGANAQAGGILGQASATSAGIQGAGNALNQGVSQYFTLRQLGLLSNQGGQPYYSGGDLPPSQYYGLE